MIHLSAFRRRARTGLSLATLALLAACGSSSDDGTPAGIDDEPTGSQPETLPVRGHGAIDGRYTAELTVRGDWAYTSTWGRRGTTIGNAVYVWDVRGATPELRDSVLVDGVSTLGDVQVSDDGALLVVATEPTGSLAIFSLADPARPQLLTRYQTPNVAPGVHTAQVSRVNGVLYAFCAIDPRVDSPSRLVIVDLSNPAAPREVFVRTMGAPFIHDVFVRDGHLFTALWDGGLTIWAIGANGRGAPASPDSLGNVRTTGGEAHNVWWLHDPVTGNKRYAFVGQEGPGSIGAASSGDVHVVDVSDVAKPREVAIYHDASSGTHNFSVDEASGILYAAYYDGGVRALDVRGDLGTCTSAQRAADGLCDLEKMGRLLARGLADGSPPVYVWGVEWTPGGLYASDMLGGLWKLGVAGRPSQASRAPR